MVAAAKTYPLVKTDDACIPGMTGYPACDECNAAYEWRWCISLSQGEMWAWFRSCKHKTASAHMVKMKPRKKTKRMGES